MKKKTCREISLELDDMATKLTGIEVVKDKEYVRCSYIKKHNNKYERKDSFLFKSGKKYL